MKKRLVIFSPEAQGDVLRLYEWLADVAGFDTALGYIDRLETYCLNFDFAAERGHCRDDIRPGLRIVGFERRVTIVFTVAENTVTILRLFYGGQNWENALRRD